MDKHSVSADKINETETVVNGGHTGSAKKRNNSSKTADEIDGAIFTNVHKPMAKNSEKDKKRRPGCCQNIGYYLGDFCNLTSIHGFKLLGERGRYFLERIWWLLVIVVAFCGSSYFIYKTYLKWMGSPVVVSYAMTETPIWNIPFPAVTICPEVKVDRQVFNYTDVYLKYVEEADTTSEEDELYDFFSLVCDNNLRFTKEEESETISDDELDKLLKSLHRLSAESCRWLGVEHDCDEILSPTYTNEGLCRTFNMLDFSEIYIGVENPGEKHASKNGKPQKWTLEHGYPSAAKFKTFPRRTMLSGLKAAFQLDLFVDNENLDYLCGELQGFKVTLHHPAEAPDMDHHFRVPLNQAVVVAVKPKMITTAEELADYDPEVRQCYLPNEKSLSSFKLYTQQNCMFECLSNFTQKTCGCVGFYMPYEDNTKFCGSGSRLCMEEAKVRFLEQEVLAKLSKEEGTITEQCECLPACTSLQFDSETSQNDWDWKKTFELRANDPDASSIYERDHYSRLMVYYKEMQFLTSERRELYGTVNLLSNCGGLLALFCGFSFTSLMEILYFLTLRFCCNVRKYASSLDDRKIERDDPDDPESHT